MDPLDQLKDIHLPQEIHNYPVSLGWWLLAFLILLLLVVSLLKIRQSIMQGKAKKLALKKLANVGDAKSAVKVLKWSLLQYFPRQQVAYLSGQSLQSFLTAIIPTKQQATFNQLCQSGFDTIYQRSDKTGENEESSQNNIIEATTFWIKHALPPKKELLSDDLTSLTNISSDKPIQSEKTVLSDNPVLSNNEEIANTATKASTHVNTDTKTSKILEEKL